MNINFVYFFLGISPASNQEYKFYLKLLVVWT